MKVLQAKTAGFCLGVSLALKKLDKALAEDKTSPGRLITLGPIIHNPLVMQAYQEQGVLCLNTATEVQPGDRVVIRAHGIPKEVEEDLHASGATIIDATCPKVKKAQLAIAREAAKNRTLLLYGEEDHPEVQGLVSYAGHNAHVFGSLTELERLPLTAGKRYFLAAQTTQDEEAFTEIAAWVKKHCGGNPPVLHTICNATRERQQEVLALATKVDFMVVVGGLNSGNTRRLAEVAKAQGTATVHVEQVADMPANVLHGANVVGLTAGASTPDAHIAAMREWLEQQ